MASNGRNPVDSSVGTRHQQPQQGKKWIAVGVLAIGLIVALWTQPGKRREGSASSALVPTIAIKSQPVGSSESEPDVEAIAEVRSFARLEADAIHEVDLFQPPYVPPQPEPVEEVRVEPNKSLTVGAVYGGFGSKVRRALVNDVVVRGWGAT